MVRAPGKPPSKPYVMLKSFSVLVCMFLLAAKEPDEKVCCLSELSPSWAWHGPASGSQTFCLHRPVNPGRLIGRPPAQPLPVGGGGGVVNSGRGFKDHFPVGTRGGKSIADSVLNDALDSEDFSGIPTTSRHVYKYIHIRIYIYVYIYINIYMQLYIIYTPVWAHVWTQRENYQNSKKVSFFGPRASGHPSGTLRHGEDEQAGEDRRTGREGTSRVGMGRDG